VCRAPEPQPLSRRPGHGQPRLDRRQALAANSTPVAQYGPAALGRVAAHKPVLPLAAYLRRLILSFHKICSARTPPRPIRLTPRQETLRNRNAGGYQ
jgi:hypothetical protein